MPREMFEITTPHCNNFNWLVVYLLLYHYEKSIGSQSSIRYWSVIKSWPSYYLQGIDIYNVCFIEILKPLSHVIKSCKRFLRDKFVIYWFENLQQFSVPSRTDDHRWSLTRCFVCIPSNYAIVVYIFCDKNRKTWIGFVSM